MAGAAADAEEELGRARIPLAGPLDVPGSLAGFGRWGDDQIDRWNGDRWLRTIRVGDETIGVRARSTGSIEKPGLELEAPARWIEAASAAIASAFVQESVALAQLAQDDPVVAEADVRFPGIRPVLTLDPLTALIRSISAQQVNLRWAAEVRRRLAERYGVPRPVGNEVVRSLDAGALADATVDELRALQLTTVKARSVIAVARAALDGALDRDELDRLDDDAVIGRLVGLYGIGLWSAEWFLARTLGRPRVVAGDLGVRKAVGRAYFNGRMPTEAEVRSATRHWGAAAGVVQQLLLNTLL